MKNPNQLIHCTFLIFFQLSLNAQVFPTSVIVDNGPTDKRINLVFMGDGYTSGEMTDYLNDVTDISNDLFTQTPFKEYASFFNVFAIEVHSNESGSDHPGTATDVSEPVFPVSFADTYFNTTFDAFNIHRLLTPNNSAAQFSVLADNVPDYDQPFILVNSPHYGGSGGFFSTSSTHSSAAEIAIHEIGHSFANLSDEYWAGDFYAGESANMTQQTNPALVKWEEWYGEEGIGIYQHCCGGSSSNWYRPHQDCKMRYLGSPFCAVCRERIIDVIYDLVSPVDNTYPELPNQIFDGTPLVFSADLVFPDPNTLQVEWFLNDLLFDSGSSSITLTETVLVEGNNTLLLVVTDETTLSRSYLPESGYVFTANWLIDNQYDACPATIEVSDNPIPEGTYQAGIELSSSSTVFPGISVTFKAGELVILNNGFEVKAQGELTIENEDCID